MNHKGTKDIVNHFERIDPETEKMAGEVVDAAYKIHRTFGPGLLESAYEACMVFEVKKRGFKAESQVPVPLIYEGIKLDVGFRIDLLVEVKLIVELKAVEALLPIHEAQVITYLKVTQRRLGLLLNFNVPLIKDGIQRVIL